MSNRIGQISLEYMILTGFVVFALLLPGFLLLFNSTNSSLRQTITNQKIIDMGNGLVSDAKQMYYLGLYSRKISSYEIPENVQNIFILKIANGTNEYYYLGVNAINGEKIDVHTFMCDVPLTSELSQNVIIDNSIKNSINECNDPDYTCEFYSFVGSTTKPGLKQFKIETVWHDGLIQSSIVPVLK